MMNQRLAFNMILAFLTFFLVGCHSTGDKKKGTFLRFHLETNPDGTHYNHPVPIYRANPIFVNVVINPALDEAYMSKAEIVDVDEQGGFALKITFNPRGTQLLDYITTANKGRRLAVQAQWTEDRWLAAPLITKRIADGAFIFTPDASREESERIVLGLQNVIKQLSKPYTF